MTLDSRPCSVDARTLHRGAVMTGTAAHLGSPEASMAEAFGDGLAAALRVILADEQALSRARWAFLNAPPHGPRHTNAARMEHTRAAILAAFTLPESER